MKKLLCVFIALVLLLVLATPVIGATMDPAVGYTLTQKSDEGEITGEYTKDVLVEYNVRGEVYYVSIPGDIEFTGQDDYLDCYVNLTKITLSGNRMVEVSVKSKHGWEMMQHEGDILKTDTEGNNLPGISYTMKYFDQSGVLDTTPASQSGVTSEIVILIAHALSDTTEKKIRFTMVDNPPNTGSYKDTLTFTSRVVNQQ